jgi:hypothetical protein
MLRYAIRYTPGDGLLQDESTGGVIYYNTYAEAEEEAQRLTRQAYNNPRIAHLQADLTPEPCWLQWPN